MVALVRWPPPDSGPTLLPGWEVESRSVAGDSLVAPMLRASAVIAAGALFSSIESSAVKSVRSGGSAEQAAAADRGRDDGSPE